jgi:hypothetical protein
LIADSRRELGSRIYGFGRLRNCRIKVTG